MDVTEFMVSAWEGGLHMRLSRRCCSKPGISTLIIWHRAFQSLVFVGATLAILKERRQFTASQSQNSETKVLHSSLSIGSCRSNPSAYCACYTEKQVPRHPLQV
jgi:hypothetical protein